MELGNEATTSNKVLRSTNIMKVLAIAYSDIHHNIWSTFNKDYQRTLVAVNAENMIFEKAADLDVPVLFTGDIAHNEKSLSNELLSIILPHYRGLERWETKMYAISGNHDQCEINTADHKSISYVKTFADTFSFVKCMDFKVEYLTDKVVIFGIPYLTHDSGLLEVIKSLKPKAYKGVKRILMLHTTLPGTEDTDGRLIQTNTIGKEVMDYINKHFELIITGHIHKPLKLGPKVLQIGATNQQRKTDRDCSLGYWIIYKDLSWKFVRLDTPKFIELKPGEKIPKDKDNYYYHSIAKVEHKDVNEKHKSKFENTDDKRKIAKAYLKERQIKDKVKRERLIQVLKEIE